MLTNTRLSLMLAGVACAVSVPFILRARDARLETERFVAALPDHALSNAPAPEFYLPQIELGAGKTSHDTLMHSLAQYRGDVVVINFWATWCGPCVAEQKDLSDVARSFRGKHVQVLGVAKREWRERVAMYARRHDVAYPLLLDQAGDRVSEAYSVVGIPQTFVIDRNSVVRKWIYDRVTREQLAEAIKQTLGF